MNSLLFGVIVLFCLFDWVQNLNVTVQKPLLSIARAITENKKLNYKKVQNKGAYLFPTSHKKQLLRLSSPAEVLAELLKITSSGPVDILREEQIRNAKDVVKKIQKAALRASPCRKGAVNVCRKACKKALKVACIVYKCKSRLKSKFKSECKNNCRRQYKDM